MPETILKHGAHNWLLTFGNFSQNFTRLGHPSPKQVLYDRPSVTLQDHPELEGVSSKDDGLRSGDNQQISYNR
jgi:hypothetical protein